MYILQSQLMLNLFFALSCLCCYCREEFEETKRVIRICISKKNRQHNGQKDKRTHDLQNTTKKTKDWAIRIPPKNRGSTQVLRKGKNNMWSFFVFPCFFLFCFCIAFFFSVLVFVLCFCIFAFAFVCYLFCFVFCLGEGDTCLAERFSNIKKEIVHLLICCPCWHSFPSDIVIVNTVYRGLRFLLCGYVIGQYFLSRNWLPFRSTRVHSGF